MSRSSEIRAQLWRQRMNRAFSYRHPRETWWKGGWLRAYRELGSQKTHERASLAFRRWMNCEAAKVRKNPSKSLLPDSS